MAQRTRYRIAGQSLLVEAQDTWAARVIDTLFAGWHLAPEGEVSEEPSAPALVMRADTTPALVMRADTTPAPIPTGLQEFEIAGGGTCYTDGTTSYIDIDGSIVAIGKPGLAAAEIWTGGSPEAPALTRAVSYALSAALRQRRLFELHGSAVVHPNSERGVLIVGPSGSGKSTLTVHLASAGWSFLTDDVLLLSEEFTLVRAWPLRRCFAITSDTFAASSFLQMRSSLDDMDVQDDDKRQFAPHQVFTSDFKESCIPRTLFFSRLTGERHSRVSRLSAGDTMAGLIRMSPWSCYDRLTAAQHLAVLSVLARQSSSYSLLAGKDLLDSETAVDLISRCTCD